MKMSKVMLIFIAVSILNVILATVKSIVTIKGSKLSASLMNGIYFGYYNIVMIFTVASNGLTTLDKVLITALTNFVGVYIVKWVEEYFTKDKLWKIEMTVRSKHTPILHYELEEFGIPHNYIENVGNHTIFSCYCATQEESSFVTEIGKRHDAKFFACKAEKLI
jgi:uncharacterized protein YebE (UPF0316 family)